MNNRLLLRTLAKKLLDEASTALNAADKSCGGRDSHFAASIMLTYLARAIMKTEEEL